MNYKKRIILIINALIFMLIAIIFFNSQEGTKRLWGINQEKQLVGGEESSFNLVIDSQETKIKQGDTVTLKLSVTDINVGENGINSIIGFLEYDKEISPISERFY